MKDIEGIRSALGIFYRTLPLRRRRQGLVTLGLMLVGAAAEMLAISSVLVFLMLLTDPARLTTSRAWHVFRSSVAPNADPFTIATAGFIAVMVVSGTARLLLNWQTSSFSVNAALDFSAAAFRKVSTQPYQFYLENGSDKILSRTERIYIINNVILSGVQAFVSSVLSVMLMVFLLLLDPLTAIMLAALLVGTYLVVSMAVRTKLRQNSYAIASAHVARVRHIQQAIGGIRDILIDRSQSVFQGDFERTAERTRLPSVSNAVIATSPRILIEVVSMVALSILSLILARKNGGLVGSLPTLGGLAMGAQRLLPLLQQSYFGWSQFLGFRETILEIAQLLALPDPKPPTPNQIDYRFADSIGFDHVGFAYGAGQPVIHDLCFSIRKGERIGIVGTSGSGKSTVTDLVLGLLKPTSGRILIDSKELDQSMVAGWQAQVAHVPQSIYLSDDSIAANIAFGVPEGDRDTALIESAARSAGIHEFIIRMPDDYQTSCGERGIRLSGGQRQRIGIARALYKHAIVLVLDEATSALDDATEQAVIASIAGLASDITVIMVAHRLTTLRDCDRILQIEQGRLIEIAHSEVGIDQAVGRER